MTGFGTLGEAVLANYIPMTAEILNQPSWINIICSDYIALSLAHLDREPIGKCIWMRLFVERHVQPAMLLRLLSPWYSFKNLTEPNVTNSNSVKQCKIYIYKLVFSFGVAALQLYVLHLNYLLINHAGFLCLFKMPKVKKLNFFLGYRQASSIADFFIYLLDSNRRELRRVLCL